MRSNLRYYLILFLGLCGFAILPLFVESIVLENFPPVYAYFLRFFLTAMILIIIGLFIFPIKTMLNKAYLKIFFWGLSVQLFGIYGYFIACQEIGTASTSVMSYAFYLWVFLYEIAFRGRKINLGVGLGMCFLILGCLALLKFNPQTLNIKGFGGILICTLAWAFIFTILESNRLNYYLSTLYLVAGVACGFAVICVFQGLPLINLNLVLKNIYFFIGFSLLSTLLPYLANIYILPRIGAYKLAIFSNIEQILVLIVTGFLLQVPLLPSQVFAGSMIVLGVFCAIYFDNTKQCEA